MFQIVVRSRAETVFAFSLRAGLSSGFHPAAPRDTTRVGHPHDKLKKGAFVTRPCLAFTFDAARLQCIIDMA
ncbi:hypothetical protein [Ralstonia insidiosa]|uniref:hypothetical protein n=1 Tax=Ralstonia insidiosa TaxID=190721 RepID=UPI0012E974E9|nr:hypothetical protein [Ralstonia insidiosa]